MSRVLCIDDEPAILRLLEVILKRGGHEAILAANAQAALSAFQSEQIDAVLLDLGLPDRDGLELLGTLRATCAAPVIVLSARSEVQEKVAALDLGANDYVTKPFDGDELLARVRAALRGRANPLEDSEVIAHGSIRIDLARHAVEVAGHSVALTRKEFEVLKLLVAAGGRIQTHAAILESVWGKAHREDVEYLRVIIRSMRLKIEDDPSQPELIRNEPGIGYRLGEYR